jgi:hypothetical protein
MQVTSHPVAVNAAAPDEAAGPPAPTAFADLLAQADAQVDAATRAAWADPNDPVNQAFWADMERLTPADRAMIAVATGYDVPARGSGARPVAPMLAFHISMDRHSGVLAPGQEVTATYLLAKRTNDAGDNPVLAAELTEALAYAERHHI